MIETPALVVACAPGIAWVETERRSACSTCGHGAGCGTSVIAGLFGQTPNRLAVVDAIGLTVSDRVVIGIPDSLVVRASLVAYGLPLLTLVAGAVSAESLGAADILVAVGAIGGLILGLAITAVVTGGAKGRRRYQPVVLRRETAGTFVQFEPRQGAGLAAQTQPR